MFGKLLGTAALLIVLFTVLFPIYWMAASSVKIPREIIARRVTLVPQSFTTQHYEKLLSASNFPTYTVNSLIVSLSTMVISVTLAVLAGYGVYQTKFFGSQTFLRAMLVAYAFPTVLLIVPLYFVLSALGLVDTYYALIIVNVTLTAPFAVWLLQAFFRSVPQDIVDAALVDGAGQLFVLWRIVLPLIAPGIAAISIFCFVTSWTEYLFASILINSDALRTLPPGLAGIIGQYQIDWGLLMAGAVAVTLPVVIIFALFGRSFVSGLTQGAVKV
ncbi:MAG: carbohydrate ABC transporter permease [Anaerolineae bacterium]|nr:carbohydrate ABC transporter permease [Anaerolineae bacterium]